MDLNKLLSHLNYEEKDLLYRMLWMEKVEDDIRSFLEEADLNLSNDQITFVAELYVYYGRYDCNLSYWDNINNLVQETLRDNSCHETALSC